MPVHEGIAALLSGSYINYFHCIKIIEILKETEADSRNLFGRYGSQRMKDWQDVVKSYERENLYLAEAAQMLVRNVSYEIPGLKKQIVKEEQMQSVSVLLHRLSKTIVFSIRRSFTTSCFIFACCTIILRAILLALQSDV